MTLSFMPGIQAASPLKSLATRHTRSIGALITVLTNAFGISALSSIWYRQRDPVAVRCSRLLVVKPESLEGPDTAARTRWAGLDIYGITLFYIVKQASSSMRGRGA